MLPFTLGGLTVTALGQLRPGAAFCSPSALYPTGYAAESVRPSYKHPTVKVRGRETL